MEYLLTQAVQEESIEVLRDIISIRSVLSESNIKEGAPFGLGIRKCLDRMIYLCNQLGMRTYIDEEGYYGYSEVGEGDELLVILCHLDVVPEGNLDEWMVDPYQLTIIDDKLYGRGTQDDKGPTIAALFGLKALMNQSITFKRRVRFVFGTDEENLWRCLDHYNQKEEQATVGFAPDADFPLVYAEKGLLQCYLIGPGAQEFQLHLDNPLNVVPDQAIYRGNKLVEIQESLAQTTYDYDLQLDHIVVKGKSVHSKNAPEGINAILGLIQVMNEHYDHPVLDFVSNKLTDPKGRLLFGNIKDDVSGTLTVNLASLTMTEEQSRIGLDIRIPVQTNKETIVERLIKEGREYGLSYEEYDYLASLYVPKESELVQTLLTVYRQLTGDQTEPLVSGGATFARTIHNCVAFGARMADVPTTYHQINENMPLKNFYEAMEIYAHAIKKLAT